MYPPVSSGQRQPQYWSPPTATTPVVSGRVEDEQRLMSDDHQPGPDDGTSRTMVPHGPHNIGFYPQGQPIVNRDYVGYDTHSSSYDGGSQYTYQSGPTSGDPNGVVGVPQPPFLSRAQDPYGIHSQMSPYDFGHPDISMHHVYPDGVADRPNIGTGASFLEEPNPPVTQGSSAPITDYANSNAMAIDFAPTHKDEAHTRQNIDEHAHARVMHSVQCGCGLVLTGAHAKGNLTRHQRSRVCKAYAVTRECVCQDCGQIFFRSDALLNHRRKKHGAPPGQARR